MWKWNDLKRFLTKSATRDTKDLAAIMWPVAYPVYMEDAYNPKNPHVTVVIFNDINNPELGFTKEDVIDAVREVKHDVMLYLTVEGLDWFGPDQNVPVLRVSHDYLFEFYDEIKKVLAKRGIPIDNTYPEYKPHITITELSALDGAYPRKLMTRPVEVWWGDVHYKVD